MDRVFLDYYEEELQHIRSLATEFSALHPNVARNLSMDSVPCPDPYVERLLEGVAFLAARTRLKVDAESSRFVRDMIDTLYPDLAGPAPAMTIAEFAPGPQVDVMVEGHVVRRGTRLVSSLREGTRTRCTYTTAQAVRMWPLRLMAADYLQDKGALMQAGLSERATRDASAGLRLKITRRGVGPLSELSLDSLPVFFGAGQRGGAIFDAIFGFGAGAVARPADGKSVFTMIGQPAMVGIKDDEALLPRVRQSFEGYRLLREYFLMPERFHFVRLNGLSGAVQACSQVQMAVEIVILLSRPRAELTGISAADFRLFATPLVNLFEHECNIVELRQGRSAHPVHADRTRPKDFEIFRLLRVDDAAAEGAQASLAPLISVEARTENGHVYTTERRPRRPDTEEVRRGQTRSSYSGDDFYISVARPAGTPRAAPITQLDIRALCTNRDLPILDDRPTLTLETGDPVQQVRLLGPMRRPRPSLRASLPSGATDDRKMDDLTWRWISQLSLNHLSLAVDDKDAEPLRALIRLYADRGDPALAQHGEALTRVTSRAVVDRLDIRGPLCFAHGTEITLGINEALLSGGSQLLLSALLARLFSRQAAINSFVRSKTRLVQSQMEVVWPMTTGTRALI
ncbi:type VI secretion system baseplate subunit TssF [Paracoccus marinaquae]|uniref:Type VI secretion system baseplate subunit TssF n=1 Tax=Paracoccus marinaquae TaxID=2841926 RepID=A0ABS6ALP6_9RHOB|nr:type VI secretion system baseplate subunit TssF [Paracoccus marinaquae]MBU3031503.1 type VI secretion system baseplate subunit TssF [Paracoccus marinaquae]